jgi:hypothetical protein
MIQQQRSIEAVHGLVRHAWRMHVVPACQKPEKALLLAALVVACTSLDEVLAAEGYPGETPADRLSYARNSFSQYSDVCAARRFRHRMVHHLEFHPTWEAAMHAIAVFAVALWEHGVDLDGIWGDALTIDEAQGAVLPSFGDNRGHRRAPSECVERGWPSRRVSAAGTPV